MVISSIVKTCQQFWQQLRQLNWSQLKDGLTEYYLVDPFIVFKQFRFGAIAFGIGLGLILYSNSAVEASVRQELLALIGLAIGIVGFMVAMLAQMRLMIGRFVRFFANKD